jgi:uncharacterized membrane protein
LNKRQLKKRAAKPQQSNDPQMTLGLHAHRHEHDHKHQLTVTPFPSAEEIGNYGQVDPTFPDRLLTLIEKRVEADIQNDKAMIELERDEQSIRDREVTEDYRFKRRGQLFAIVSLIFLGSLAIFFALIGFEKTAGTIIGVTILGAITAFTGLNSEKKKNKKNGANLVDKKG